MNNYTIKENLLKLKKAGVMSIQGRTEVLKCLVIPIECNHLYTSVDENNKAKAVYLDMTAWEVHDPKYGDTHMLKQSLPKEIREQMSEEEKKSIPILGGMKPFTSEQKNGLNDCDVPFAQVENLDELPF